MVDVKFIKLQDNAIMPTYGTEYSAGADLYALPGEKITVPPGETVIVHTGIALQIPEGYAGLIYARSGIATKRGLAPANKVGVVDSDYRGEIMVSIHNHSKNTEVIDSGERVAQIVITPFLKANFVETSSLDDTKRSTGGFGSTGTK